MIDQSCHHPEKRHYISKKEAKNGMRGMKGRAKTISPDKPFRDLEVYECKCGGGWCIGHRPRREKQVNG